MQNIRTEIEKIKPDFLIIDSIQTVMSPEIGIIGGMARSLALKKADEALARVGLAHRLHHRVTTLSGGERQRAAIARTILLEPQVILADEPTGNLDDRTGREINDLLLNLNQDRNVTLIIVTHNAELARCMGRTLELRSGELYET